MRLKNKDKNYFWNILKKDPVNRKSEMKYQSMVTIVFVTSSWWHYSSLIREWKRCFSIWIHWLRDCYWNWVLDAFVKFWWPDRFILQNRKHRQFPSTEARVYFVLDPEFSRGHQIGLIGARDLNYFYKWAKCIRGLTKIASEASKWANWNLQTLFGALVGHFHSSKMYLIQIVVIFCHTTLNPILNAEGGGTFPV